MYQSVPVGVTENAGAFGPADEEKGRGNRANVETFGGGQFLIDIHGEDPRRVSDPRSDGGEFGREATAGAAARGPEFDEDGNRGIENVFVERVGVDRFRLADAVRNEADFVDFVPSLPDVFWRAP